MSKHDFGIPIEYQKMYEDFIKLPNLYEERKTFLDVSGYPHYEEVCSNILAFFFDTSEQHRVNTLFVKSLLEAAELGEYKVTETICTREKGTTDNGRIDLLIETDCDIVIVIENKVFAGLQNNLKDYYDSVQELYKKRVVGVVLSYKNLTKCELNEVVTNDFRYISYKDFFNRIKTNIGDFIDGADSGWLIFLREFLNTFNEKRNSNLDVIEKNIKFLKCHKKNIKNLENTNKQDEENKKLGEFRLQLEQLRKNLAEVFSQQLIDLGIDKKVNLEFTTRSYTNKGACLSRTFFKFPSHEIDRLYRFEVCRGIDGWDILLRTTNTIPNLKAGVYEWLKNNNINHEKDKEPLEGDLPDENYVIILKSFPHSASKVIVLKETSELFEKIVLKERKKWLQQDF